MLVVLRDLGSGLDGPLRSTDEAPDKEIVRAALHEDHHGYSTRTGNAHDRPVIVHRAVSSWERTRLTVAHEIGHLVLHSRELSPDAEEVAYDFAAELLAPAVVVAQHLPWPVTLAELVPIKMHFGISVAALVRHLRRHELIDDARYRTLTSQLYRRRNPASGTTWGKQEPGWDQRKPEQPRLLRTWLERCVGTAAPPAIHQMSRELWPTDLLASILSGQRDNVSARPSSSTVRQSGAHPSRGDVIDLAAWRAEQA
ncbi:MAG: ImmA/IrrE family metallo-endopeptidase [Pseudonocardiaceae bacterium]